MTFPIFGFQLSLGEILTLLTLFSGVIGGWYVLQNRVKNVESKMDDLEREGDARGQAIKDMADNIEKKLEPLQTQVRAQEQTQAALNATLASIQTQLHTVSIRLDTIISHMLNSKDKL